MKKISTLIILILSIIFLLAENIIAQCHLDDWTALKALYESTNGNSWNDNAGWQVVTSNSPPANCNLENLFGVDLDKNGRVTNLNLVGNRLNGSLPSVLGNLSNLKTLNFIFNDLNGSIPPELGNLNNLTDLELQVNDLSGNIPPELGNLSNLSGLDLANNDLTGSIPSALGNLSNLISLELEFNNLTGSIPSELGNLSKLDFLALYFNQLTGSLPPALGNLSNLKEFIINNNNLSGCYPISLNAFCTQLVPVAVNAQISDGNNFDATWSDFCFTNTGACANSCVANLIIENATPFQNLYQANNSIITLGVVEINMGQQAEYNAPYISLNKGFSVNSGASFTVRSIGCD